MDPEFLTLRHIRAETWKSCPDPEHLSPGHPEMGCTLHANRFSHSRLRRLHGSMHQSSQSDCGDVTSHMDPT